MTINKTIQQWHQFVKSGNLNILDEILADDVVFHSPVVHSPQNGKALTKTYLHAAYIVFKDNDFIYQREIISGHQAVLEFETSIDEIIINGVDIIECNNQGKITEFKVMIRPLQGLQKIQNEMFKMLKQV